MSQDYIPLATVTLASSASSVTFSSIPATYRDLILVVAGTVTPTGIAFLDVTFNGVSGSLSNVWMRGFSGGTGSGTNVNLGILDSSGQSNIIIQVMDYSATDKHKTYLTRSNAGADSTVWANAGRWASTSAVTSISIFDPGGKSFLTGTTASLYGIVA